MGVEAKPSRRDPHAMFRSISILGKIWALFGGTILGGYPHGAPCHRPHKLGHPNDGLVGVCGFLGHDSPVSQAPFWTD